MKFTKYPWLAIAFFTVYQVALVWLKAEDLSRNDRDNSSNLEQKSRFIGHTIEYVEKELGAPARPPDTLKNGRQVFIFFDNQATERTRKANNPNCFVSGYTIIVDKGIVVDERINLGKVTLNESSPSSKPKYFIEFMPVSETREKDAVKVPVPGEIGHNYYWNASLPICDAGVENIDIQWDKQDVNTLIIRILLSERYIERLRKFTVGQIGHRVVLMINGHPIGISLINTEIDTGDFKTSASDSPELLDTLKELGIPLPKK